MPQSFLNGVAASFHRIDLPCEQTGFSKPPFDVHIKFIPAKLADNGWTLLAHAAAGKPDVLARWLEPHPGIQQVMVAPGIAPKLLRARAVALPQAWANVASFVKIHHLDIAPDGHACWFVEGSRERILALVQNLAEVPEGPVGENEIRWRPVHGGGNDAPISRRQFEALASAVALGYYEIPHRVDLRAIAARAGISLGSVSELLRRAEGAILTRYVDTHLMRLPKLPEEDTVSQNLLARESKPAESVQEES